MEAEHAQDLVLEVLGVEVVLPLGLFFLLLLLLLLWLLLVLLLRVLGGLWRLALDLEEVKNFLLDKDLLDLLVDLLLLVGGALHVLLVLHLIHLLLLLLLLRLGALLVLVCHQGLLKVVPVVVPVV